MLGGLLVFVLACTRDDGSSVTPDDMRVLSVEFEAGVLESDVLRLVSRCGTKDRTEVRIDAAPDLLIMRPTDADYRCYDTAPGVARVLFAD